MRGYNGEIFGLFKLGDNKCSRASTLCGVGGHVPYGHEGGKVVEAQG